VAMLEASALIPWVLEVRGAQPGEQRDAGVLLKQEASPQRQEAPEGVSTAAYGN